MQKKSITILVALVALASCNKNTDTANEKESAPATGGAESAKPAADPVEPAPAAPAAKIWYAIPELGIQVEVPGAPTHELVLTDWYAVNAPGCDLQIGKPFQGDDFYAETLQTLERNVTRIQVVAFSKKEKQADGSFSVEAELKTRKGQSIWYVQNRVKIDGTPLTLFGCSSATMKTPEHAACVSHACATAKKL